MRGSIIVKTSALIVVAIAIFVPALFVFNVWQEANDAAIYACIVSIEQGLINHSSSGEHSFTDVGEAWKLLDESTSERLIPQASKIHSFDCSSVSRKGIGTDYWGNRFVIFVSRTPESARVVFKVKSKGRDGIINTQDDLGGRPK